MEQERVEQESQDHHELEGQKKIWKEERSQGDPRRRESQKEGHEPTPPLTNLEGKES